MQEYHKIQTVYLRDPATKLKKLLEGQWSRQEFAYLQGNTWVGTEKVDGTNTRVIWDLKDIEFEGRTNDSQISTHLYKKLKVLFPVDKFKELYPETPMCLCGEGYGAKIQKGGKDYLSEGVGFILFDVKIETLWIERHNVEDIANKLDIPVVPIVYEGSLKQAIDLVKEGFDSHLRETPPEGLVLRPKVELINRRGERIITKIKRKDFN